MVRIMDVEDFVEGLEGRKSLSEDEVKGLLFQYDIPTTRFSVILPEQAFNDYELEYPLVMKVASPDILHKTEVGGVILGIKDKDEAESAFISLREQFPSNKILVESMELPGLELIAGIIRDDSFGLSIMVGLGGIFTEVLEDVSFRVIPITEYDATRMIQDLAAAKVLDGFRGTKVNRDLLIDILLKLSKLGEDFDPYLKEMDLNPIILRENDAVVVDAKMQLK
jgi:acetyl-CoA synthetase (ADP-forming)